MAAYFQAMREDLTITRFPAFSDLLHYMDGSAIPVGRGMTYILGVSCERTGPCHSFEDALHGADCLSIAMQLSNFWRDIGPDWSIGRVYIPQEDMERFGYRESDLAAGSINANLIDLLEFEIERTEGYYAVARQSVKMLESGRWAVMSALEIYQRHLEQHPAQRLRRLHPAGRCRLCPQARVGAQILLAPAEILISPIS